MRKVTNSLYIVLGLLFFGVGAIGVILPVLPATPFLLSSCFLFSRSSTRWQRWFSETLLYKKCLQPYFEKNGMTLKHKISLLLFSDVMLAFPFFEFSSIYIRTAILVIAIIKYWYLLFVVKTVP